MNHLVICSKCEKINRVSLEKAKVTAPICASCKSNLPFDDGVQDISGEGLTKLIRVTEKPLVVDFWAEWCGPCKAFAPTFKSAARELENHMQFAKLDTEMFPEPSQIFQIRGIPTLIIFNKGQEIARQSGAMPLTMLRDYLAKYF